MQPGHDDESRPAVHVGEAFGARGETYKVIVEDGSVFIEYACDSHAPMRRELGVRNAEKLSTLLDAAASIAQVANP